MADKTEDRRGTNNEIRDTIHEIRVTSDKGRIGDVLTNINLVGRYIQLNIYGLSADLNRYLD